MLIQGHFFIMKTITYQFKYRNSLGHFTTYKPKEHLTKELYYRGSKIAGNKIYLKGKEDNSKTRIIAYNQMNQKIKNPMNRQIHHGTIIYKGVKITSIYKQTKLTKQAYDNLIKNIDRGFSRKAKKGKSKKDLKKEFIIKVFEDLDNPFDSPILKANPGTPYHAVGAASFFDIGEKRKFVYRKSEPMIDFMVLDTEDNSKGDVKLCIFYNGQTFKIFKNDNSDLLKFEVQNYLYYNCLNKNIFALNLQYDLINIFGEDLKRENLTFSNNMILSANVYLTEKDKINFYEGFSHLQMSIEKIGEVIDFQKLKTKNKINITYCKRDCKILYKGLKKIFDFDVKNGVDFGLTTASKAIRFFRKNYIPDNFYQYDFNGLKCAYRGGRVELFKIGKFNNIRVYDINSLYPYAMKSFKYPDPGNVYFSNELKPMGIYYIKVKVKKSVKIPLLGIIHKGKYIFPVGEFSGTFTGHEILKAIDENQIDDYSIYSGIEFDEIKGLFSEFVDHFYNIRKKSNDELTNKYCKLILNSLYGKFAQGKDRKVYDPETDLIKLVPGEKFPNHTNSIWSIFITSYARCYLFDFLKTVNYDNLLYTDTDSIHLINEKLTCSKNIGDLKLEGFFHVGNYISPKTYYLENLKTGQIKSACKGIPKLLHKEYIENGKVNFKRPVKLIEFLHNKNVFGKTEKLNNWVDIIKENKYIYNKREIIGKTKNTKPLILKET